MQPVQRSIFDSENMYSSFWKQIADSDMPDQPSTYESQIFVYNSKKTRKLEPFLLRLQIPFLIYQKNKDDKYLQCIDLNEFMYKVKPTMINNTNPSSKYHFSFLIYVNGKSFEFFIKDKTVFYKWLSYFRKFCIMTNLNDVYEKHKTIGTGGYGEVLLLEDRITKEKRAGKFINLISEQNPKYERQKVMLINEIKMLRKLNHPNLVKMYELYELDNKVCIVMEYLEGQSLYTYLRKIKSLTEKDTAFIIKQLLLTLGYLESLDIIHRDIKLENIMLITNKSGIFTTKLIDFGLSTFHRKRDIIKKCGTAGYVAPEVLNNELYDFKADLFSIGVILYMCLVGRPPFYAEDYDDLLEKNRNCTFTLKSGRWLQLSSEVKHLTTSLLERNPAKRLSLENAITHVWLQKQLPEVEYKKLLEIATEQNILRMSIPDEKRISRIPSSMGQISKITSSLDIANKFESGSTSFVTSTHLLENNNTPLKLNSFYKFQPSKEMGVSTESLNSAKTHKRMSFVKSQTLAAPNKRSLYASLNRLHTRVHEFHSQRDLESSKFNIRIIDAFDDETMIPDEEDSTCEDRMLNLETVPDFFFSKLYPFQNRKILQMQKSKHAQI